MYSKLDGQVRQSSCRLIATFPQLFGYRIRNKGLHKTRRHGDGKMYHCRIADDVLGTYTWYSVKEKLSFFAELGQGGGYQLACDEI